jgi:beta-glucanase (GH16 family)
MLVALTALALTAAPALKLVWHDEFDGPTLDARKWNIQVDGEGGGNQELQYYTARPQNVRVENGELVITSRKERYTGPDGTREYTSGRINTDGKFARTYGRYEARMKLPRGQGMWPAFWLLGQDRKQHEWPACGEIDIMENIGKEPGTVHGSIHGPGYSGADGLNGPYAASLDGYHVYALDWDKEQIIFYMDGVPYCRRTRASIPKGAPWPFDHPFFIILNNAVGGSWPGSPDDTTEFPQELRVDYVRVWSAD